MFTGIIQEVGTVQSIKYHGSSAELTIEAPNACEDAQLGDSICTNGVCLTAIHLAGNAFKAELSEETLNRSTMRNVHERDRVNVEPSLRPHDRMGGHIVAGHVDGIGSIHAMEDLGEFINLIVNYPKPLAPFIAEKGSIAIDGISLTVTTVTDTTFGVALVPWTIKETNLQYKNAGDEVNLEADVIARYVQRMMQVSSSSQGVTMETLREHGFLNE